MPLYGYSPEVIKDWLIGGVDFNLAGNGGPTCTDFTPPARRYFEFIFGSLFGVLLLAWAYRYLSFDLRKRKCGLSLKKFMFYFV